MFRVVFWDILPCKMIVDRGFRGAYCLHHQGRVVKVLLRTLDVSLDYLNGWSAGGKQPPTQISKHSEVSKHLISTKECRMLNNNFQICEISSSHGGEYEVQICLLGCTAV
jgi:hypothetical protein